MRQPLNQPGIFRTLDWFANCFFRHLRLPITFTRLQIQFPASDCRCSFNCQKCQNCQRSPKLKGKTRVFVVSFRFLFRSCDSFAIFRSLIFLCVLCILLWPLWSTVFQFRRSLAILAFLAMFQITRSPVTSPRSSTSSFSPRIALPAQCSGIPYTGTNFPPARGVSLHPSDQDCAAESALPP